MESFHLKSDVDGLYVEKSKAGTGVLSVKDVVEKERQLKLYSERSL